MAVVIEELQAEVAPSAPQPSPGASPPPGDALDERKLLEALAREYWENRRLAAD